MRPDRINYEMWLIDYLDGNLTEEQVELLLSFLEENPDLKDEFEGISDLHLSVPSLSFGNKPSLKKAADEISETQFDLLCAASVENDLTPEQRSEFNEIILSDNERKRSAGLYAKTKLTPPSITFRNKNKLKRLTLAAKVFRISAVAVSAAATVLVLFTLLGNPEIKNSDLASVSGSQVSGNRDKRTPGTVKETPVIVPGKKEENKEKLMAVNTEPTKVEKSSTEMMASAGNDQPADTALNINSTSKSEIEKISGKTEMSLENSTAEASLIAMNLTPVDPFAEEEGNPEPGFITRIFREKIYKSDTQEKGTLKAYEVADAGINGLNKLFGWDMSLKKTRNDRGEVKSVYFSSKLVKFNAPVKKVASNP